MPNFADDRFFVNIDPQKIYEYGYGSDYSIDNPFKMKKTTGPEPNKQFQGVFLDENGKPKKGTEFKGTMTRTLYVSGLVYAFNPMTRDFVFVLIQLEDGNIALPADQLRYGETCRQALNRILYTDIGLKVREQNVKEKVLDDNPKKNEAQDIVFRYMVELQYKDLQKQTQYGEINRDTAQRGGTKKINKIIIASYGQLDEIKGISKPLRQMIEQFIERRYKI